MGFSFIQAAPETSSTRVSGARIGSWVRCIEDSGDGVFLPSGKRLHNYGKSPFLMGKSTISMAIFNSYVSLPEGKSWGYRQLIQVISIIRIIRP